MHQWSDPVQKIFGAWFSGASHLVQSFVVNSLNAHTLEKQNIKYFALLILHCIPVATWAGAWGKTGFEFLQEFYLYAIVLFSLKVKYKAIWAF